MKKILLLVMITNLSMAFAGSRVQRIKAEQKIEKFINVLKHEGVISPFSMSVKLAELVNTSSKMDRALPGLKLDLNNCSDIYVELTGASSRGSLSQNGLRLQGDDLSFGTVRTAEESLTLCAETVLMQVKTKTYR